MSSGGNEAGSAGARWRARVPNALTVARVALACAMFAVMAGSGLPAGGAERPIGWCLWAAGLFVVAALTDALDGYLARRWGAITRFGRIMDPFADKLLVVGAFIMLSGPGFRVMTGGGAVQASGVEAWMAVVVLGRELLVTSMRGVLERDGVDFSAGASGKAKMVLQSVCVPAVLGVLGVMGVEGAGVGWPRGLIEALVWVTVVVTVLSALPYVARARRAGLKGAD